MSSFKIATIMLALGFAAAIGCGSSDGTSSHDGPIISSGTGGALGSGGSVAGDDAGGLGGVAFDAAQGTGGVGGTVIDGSIVVDAPMVADSSGGEVAPGLDECAGLTADQCDLSIINAVTTALAVDPPNSNPPDWRVCSQ